jgi:TPR repeat protein
MRHLVFVLIAACSSHADPKQSTPANPQTPTQTQPAAAQPPEVACTDAKDCLAKGEAALEAARKSGHFEQQYEAATPYLEKSCRLGDSEGCQELVNYSEWPPQYGRGYHDAIDKACSYGHPWSCGKIGIELVKSDPTRATALLEKACKANTGDVDACEALLRLYKQGPQGTQLAQNLCALDHELCTCASDRDCHSGGWCAYDPQRQRSRCHTKDEGE